MPLIQLVGTLIVVGVLLWAMNTYIPMDPKIRQIINLVVVVAVVLWLLRIFGVLDYAKGIRVGAWQTRPRTVLVGLQPGPAGAFVQKPTVSWEVLGSAEVTSDQDPLGGLR